MSYNQAVYNSRGRDIAFVEWGEDNTACLKIRNRETLSWFVAWEGCHLGKQSAVYQRVLKALATEGWLTEKYHEADQP